MSSNYKPGDDYRTHSYAKDKSGVMVHISEVERDQKDGYFCMCCNGDMVARKGNVMIHHFAHKSLAECSGETVLHHMAKMAFFDAYKRCLKDKSPFYIGLKYKEIRCCSEYMECKKSKDKISRYDLTEFYDKIEVESKHGNFIPDIKLSNTERGLVMFIEIAVTHKCSQQKIDSGVKIVEILIKKSSDIKAIEDIPESVLSESKSVTFYNIKSKEDEQIIDDNCKLRACNVYAYWEDVKEYSAKSKRNAEKQKLFDEIEAMVERYRIELKNSPGMLAKLNQIDSQYYQSMSNEPNQSQSPKEITEIVSLFSEFGYKLDKVEPLE